MTAANVDGALDSAGGCYGIDGPDPDDLDGLDDVDAHLAQKRADRQAVTGWDDQQDAVAVALAGGADDRAQAVEWLQMVGLIDDEQAAASERVADRRAHEQWAREHGYAGEVSR